MITATQLSKNFGGQTLFRDADLQLDPGKRYGIVGANGSGKSTLLRILSGEESSSGGEFHRPRNARIGVLEQDHFQYDEVSILQVVMMGNRELWDAMVEKEAVLERAEEYFDDVRYGQLEDVVLRFDGYGLESRSGKILEGLGVPGAVHRQPLSTLSGGFKLRVLLAATLASEPDLLFLDEPTNHLDILAIRWLEEFLREFEGCAVVVSHDIRFLDAVCTDILDVDYELVTAYRGNYTKFVERKAENRARMEIEISRREKEIADHKAFIARFSAKATKARQSNSRQKRMEKIVVEELPRSSRRHPRFTFAARRQSGREVLKVRGVGKAYGDNVVLRDVSVDVERGDRIAIIGPNGIGKSTLLKICVDELAADEGTIHWGHETDVGYFPQDHNEALGSLEQTVMACLWDDLPEEGMGGVVARLATVLFSRDDVDKKVKNLSGGEASRLLFSKLTARQPTVLVLDEPTNHLDIEGIEALAEALGKYDGTLIFVSHDRWFVEKLATRVLEISHEGIDDFHGSYAEFLARAGVDHLDEEAVLAKAKAERRSKKKKKGGAEIAEEPPARTRRRKKGGGGAAKAAAPKAEAPKSDAPRILWDKDAKDKPNVVVRKAGDGEGKRRRRRRKR